MDDGSPTLGVGFAIDPEGSFATLRQLEAAMGTTEAKIVAEAAKIEKATGGMINLANGTAQITTFGNATSRELANVARETSRAEKAGEAMVRRMEQQAEVFGKSASEIRQMRAEMRAVEADSRGLTELAGRIRATSAEMDRLEASSVGFASTGNRSRNVVAALIPQVNDLGVQFAMAAQSSNPLQMAMMAIIQQGAQIQQIGMQAGVGLGGMARQMLTAIGSFLLAHPAILAVTAGIAAGAFAFKGFAETLEKRAPVNDYIKTLGLTDEEAKKLTNTHVTLGDAAGAAWDMIKEALNLESVFAAVNGWVSKAAAWLYSQFKDASASVYAAMKATYDNIGRLWKNLPDLLGDAVVLSVNKTLDAVQSLINEVIGGINWLAEKSNAVFGTEFGSIGKVNLSRFKGQYSAAGQDFGAAFGASFNKAYGQAMATFDRFETGALRNRDERLSAQADEIIKDRKKKAEKAAKDEIDLAKWAAEQMAAAYGNAWKLAQEIQQRNLEWGKGDATWGEKDIADRKAADALKQAGIDSARDALSAYMQDLDAVSDQVDRVAANMRDSFGSVGDAIGGVITVLDEYGKRQKYIDEQRKLGLLTAEQDAALQKRAALDQIGLFGDMTSAAKGFFREGSSGYKALETAEKAFRAVEFALSVRAMAQDAIETVSSIAKSGARTATKAVEAVVSAISSLPFPLNLAAGAATIGALASIGVAIAGSFGGSSNTLPKSNDGTGTVFGDVTAKSDSIKRSIDALKEVDTVMLSYSRQMAASLQSIESQIGGFASLVLRTDNVNASGGVNTGFKTNAIGSVLGAAPLIGGFIKSLFGTKTSIVGSGLFGSAQSLEDILSGGFDASYYSDVQKKKKFLGLTTSTKYSTQYGDADGELENQFTLILRQFNDAILAASGPLGTSTAEITQRLNGFVVDIGKIDLQGLTGEEIEEKLSAVFGAAADDMARAAFPGIDQFQQVGEGLFETLVRVSSTVESVTASLGLLGSSATAMGIDVKVALAGQFESLSELTSAADAYFETYYSKAEQAAARTAQFAGVFDSLGLSMPSSLAGFRALVDAQDLATAAGQATYATLLQLAPAFADLQSAMNGAKSAADILSERQNLERQMLELQGNTATIRALDLAQLDASNRALQEQVWALQDAKEAADAAQQLKDAWSSVGDSIMDEVNRIRGIADGSGTGSFATLLGQFNVATSAAKAGDQDAASSLPGLSQALLQAAELAATSRQELDRVKAQTAAALESVYSVVMAANGGTGAATGAGAPTGTILSAAATAASVNAAPAQANDNLAEQFRALRDEVVQLRNDNNSGHAATAGNTGAIKRTLDNVTSDSGGNALSVAGAAA